MRHPELVRKRITPLAFRHATVMVMLYPEVDIAIIVFWLGHEGINAKRKYVVTNMKANEEAPEKARVDWDDVGHARYKASQSVLDFLNSLCKRHGISFDDLDEVDAWCIGSNVNSEPRLSLMGLSLLVTLRAAHPGFALET